MMRPVAVCENIGAAINSTPINTANKGTILLRLQDPEAALRSNTVLMKDLPFVSNIQIEQPGCPRLPLGNLVCICHPRGWVSSVFMRLDSAFMGPGRSAAPPRPGDACGRNTRPGGSS